MDRPYYHLNFAMTADGRMADQDGARLRISSPEDMRRVHLLRQEQGAILVGVNTVLMDDPKLTVKEELVPSPRPLTKIVLDTRGRTPRTAKFLMTPGRSILAIGRGIDKGALERSLSPDPGAGPDMEVIVVEDTHGRLDLIDLSGFLLERGIDKVLVEGGPTVIGGFLSLGIWDRLTIYIGPMLVGGNGPSLSKGTMEIERSTELRLMDQQRLGEGLLLEYAPIR